jgi:hypothetical protein
MVSFGIQALKHSVDGACQARNKKVRSCNIPGGALPIEVYRRSPKMIGG